jgi:phage gp29-like protein
MAENTNILDLNKPDAQLPDTEKTALTEPMIEVTVADRLLREIKQRLFPGDVTGILLSSHVGDLYWKDQLWSMMVQTWPRLMSNLSKLKQAVSSMEYAVKPFIAKGEKDPSQGASDKADLVEDGLFNMHGNPATQEHDFKETLEDIVDSLVTGFFVAEIYWEVRDGAMLPKSTRWTPPRYWRYPYQMDQSDELLLNPSGMLGGTQLFPFPEHKFIRCVRQSHANHPVFTCPVDCLTSWWLASRFGLEWFMSYAQLFGIPQRVAYYQPGDDLTYQKLVQMMRASATATWGVYPVNTKVEVLGTAGGAGAHMPQERLIDEADKVCDILLLGQTLTTEVRESGGNRALGTVHRKVLDEILEAAGRYVAKVITTQVIPGLIQYNFGNLDELPRLEPVINTPVDLFNFAQALKIIGVDMRLPLKAEEVYTRLEFSKPDELDELYVPPAVPPPSVPFGAPQAQPEATKPEPAGTPNGNQPAALKPNIVERVGASNGDPNDDDDPDDALGPSYDIDEYITHGRFVEARHEHRHPKTGRFIPAPPSNGEPIPEVGLMCKRNVDMEDDKVCPLCQKISAEGWIPVDAEFSDGEMLADHHPNCRCKLDYKTRYAGIDIHHATKSGNPHHHPETGRFVSKPKRS